jgi:hypothetical protein
MFCSISEEVIDEDVIDEDLEDDDDDPVLFKSKPAPSEKGMPDFSVIAVFNSSKVIYGRSSF